MQLHRGPGAMQAENCSGKENSKRIERRIHLEFGNDDFSAKRIPSDKKKPRRCGARNSLYPSQFSQFTKLRSIENSLREAAKGSPSGRMLVFNKNLDITRQL
jgi:hypothetical protein